jgi:hypothetical protein
MESLITRISADANNSARLLQQRVEEGLRRQSLAKKQRGLKKGELYVKLERHPATKLRNLQLPWAKVTQQATVQTVRKLLSKIHHQTEERWTDVGLIVKPTLDANVATSSSSFPFSPESISIPEKANELDETLSLSSVYQKVTNPHFSSPHFTSTDVFPLYF